MTFLVCDSVRVRAGTVTIGAHRLTVKQSADHVEWQLQCPACPAVVSAGTLTSAGPLLDGAQALPGRPGAPAVSWAWGAAPPSGPGRGVQVVFARGLHRPAVATGHLLAPGLWVGAAPGRAGRVIAVGAGRSGERVAQVLGEQDCPGQPAGLLPSELLPSGRRRRSGRWGRRS